MTEMYTESWDRVKAKDETEIINETKQMKSTGVE